MSFFVYSCDWTQENINIQKLILMTMQINDCERNTLKLTSKKVVNMELFASVCT